MRARRDLLRKMPKPVRPAGGMADYIPTTSSLGTLTGICPVCERLIYRRVSQATLDKARGDLEITIPQARSRIRDSPPRVAVSEISPRAAPVLWYGKHFAARWRYFLVTVSRLRVTARQLLHMDMMRLRNTITVLFIR